MVENADCFYNIEVACALAINRANKASNKTDANVIEINMDCLIYVFICKLGLEYDGFKPTGFYYFYIILGGLFLILQICFVLI